MSNRKLYNKNCIFELLKIFNCIRDKQFGVHLIILNSSGLCVPRECNRAIFIEKKRVVSLRECKRKYSIDCIVKSLLYFIAAIQRYNIFFFFSTSIFLNGPDLLSTYINNILLSKAPTILLILFYFTMTVGICLYQKLYYFKLPIWFIGRLKRIVVNFQSIYNRVAECQPFFDFYNSLFASTHF